MLQSEAAVERGPLTPRLVLNPFDPSFLPDRSAKHKSHFQIAFIFIPSLERQTALADLYAFCRLVDDLSDDESLPTEARRLALEKIRGWLIDLPELGHSYWDRFRNEILHYEIPLRALDGIITGCEWDLKPKPLQFKTWEELNRYVQGVACSVGEAVLPILGAGGPDAEDYSKFMGRTLQYLNILRDLEEDRTLGRAYVPLEFKKNFAQRNEGREPSDQDARNELYTRALAYRNEARPYSIRCLPAELMSAVYFEGATKYWLSGNPKRLNKFQKVWVVAKTFVVFVFERMRAPS